MFDERPDKVPVNPDETYNEVWPEFGKKCEMNKFYQEYQSAAGWLGESFLAIWSKEEICEYAPLIAETFSSRYKFFASDGGGNQFGFFADAERINYVSAPDIGSDDDIRVLGNWKEFLNSLRTGDYI